MTKYGDGDATMRKTAEGVVVGKSEDANSSTLAPPKQPAHTALSCGGSAGQAVSAITATSFRKCV